MREWEERLAEDGGLRDVMAGLNAKQAQVLRARSSRRHAPTESSNPPFYTHYDSDACPSDNADDVTEWAFNAGIAWAEARKNDRPTTVEIRRAALEEALHIVAALPDYDRNLRGLDFAEGMNSGRDAAEEAIDLRLTEMLHD